MPARTLSFASYDLFADDISLISPDRRIIIDTLNPHSFYIAEGDGIFRQALKSADVLLPDGIGIVWACHFLSLGTIRRISGMDLFQHLIAAAAKETDERKRRIFFVGASVGTLDKIRQKIQRDHPSLEMGAYSPPFKEIFSGHDNRLILDAVKEFDPSILFVGMTAPKQEKWVYENQHEFPTTTICSVGAVFDYYAGTIRRPGAFWRRIGLEWFIRFLREPKRLWKRNLISGPYFVFRVFKLKFNR